MKQTGLHLNEFLFLFCSIHFIPNYTFERQWWQLKREFGFPVTQSRFQVPQNCSKRCKMAVFAKKLPFEADSNVFDNFPISVQVR